MALLKVSRRCRYLPAEKEPKACKELKLCLRILAVSLFVLVSLGYFIPEVLAEGVREDCRVCGMWIDQHMHTRHILTEADGTHVSFCSFTCAAKYLKQHDGAVKQLLVADYLTAELIDAEDAFYLVGSDVPPVMSYISIIAFTSREKAESFQKLHSGKIMTFDEALSQ